MKTDWVATLLLLAVITAGCRTVHRPRETATVAAPYSTAVANSDSTANQQNMANMVTSPVVTKVAWQETGRAPRPAVTTASAIPIISAVSDQSLQLMSLADFESLAMENNPTIQALAATTQKADGFRTQVGLRPNPTVGYQGMQLADRATDQHTAFIEQEFVRGGKLELNRQVLNETLRAQLMELDAQRLRVVTDVRSKFYDALGAQTRAELISEFRSVAEKGLEIAKLRREALEGSEVDVLQSTIQKSEIDLAERQARVAFESAWRELAALTGTPDLVPTRLDGELPNQVERLDWNVLAAAIVSSSPEYGAAQARICRAEANLRRQGVQAIPNVTAQLAAGVDNATGSGMINLQVGAPIPVFNKNQGNIAAARAGHCRAVMDALRIENSIKARIGAVSKDYDSALAAVRQYADEILPSASQAMELAEIAYKAGETNFVQVLVARRTWFDSSLQYVIAQTQLAQAKARIDGNVLTGAFEPLIDESGDDSLRGLTFSQQ